MAYPTNGETRAESSCALLFFASAYRSGIACAAFCVIAFTLCGTPLLAQQVPPPPLGTPTGDGDSAIKMFNNSNPFDQADKISTSPKDAAQEIISAESCGSWTASALHSMTVSVARLAIPPKASSEYQKACNAYRGTKLEEAEGHVRKAIDLYSNYGPAWVMLGQVLDAENKRPEARAACSQAMSVDPNYIAAYICLEAFAATENSWKEVEELSANALAPGAANDPYSLFYTADAYFHLDKLVEAEKSALGAVQLDVWHDLPQAHLLLAQIYEAREDSQSETFQLREYLKLAPKGADAAEARDILAHLTPQSSDR